MADARNHLPGLSGKEFNHIQGLMEHMTEEQASRFAAAYRGQRKDPTIVLLLTLVGFILVGGIGRFYLGQIGMGVLYLLTAGLFLIGTLVDVCLHRSITFDVNRSMADRTSGHMR